MAEAHAHRLLLQLDEFLGPVIANDLGMLLARPQVLADGENVDVVRAHVAEHLEQLVLGFTEADHQPRLGCHVRRQRFHVAEQSQAVGVNRLRPDARVQAGNGLGVVAEDFRPGLDDRPDRLEVALKVRRQHLDGRARAAPADGADRAREYAGATVAEVVAVDRRDDSVAEAQLGHRVGDAKRLTEVELRGPAGRDGAEPAGARADVAEDHEGGGSPVPTIEDVGTARFLANRVQAAATHDLLQIFEVLAFRDAHANPRWDGLRRQGSRIAHRRMLPAVHCASRFLMKARNCPAIMPSMMRWSKLRHMFIMLRTAIPSPITTGRRTMDSVVRIAACGWLMIGWLATEPVAPVLLSVNVPPWTSSGLSCLLRARSMRSFNERTRSVKPRWSASLRTGTMRPSGIETAMPRLT